MLHILVYMYFYIYIYTNKKIYTELMNKAVKNPSDIPIDNLGSKIPIAPPTKALVKTIVPSITPNNFIEESIIVANDLRYK